MLSLPEKAAAPQSMTQYFVVFRFVLHISVANLPLLPMPLPRLSFFLYPLPRHAAYLKCLSVVLPSACLHFCCQINFFRHCLPLSAACFIPHPPPHSYLSKGRCKVLGKFFGTTSKRQVANLRAVRAANILGPFVFWFLAKNYEMTAVGVAPFVVDDTTPAGIEAETERGREQRERARQKERER